MASKETEQLIDELFSEKFEQDTWLNQYQKPHKGGGLYDTYKIKGDGAGWGLSAEKVTDKEATPLAPGQKEEQQEIMADINFFRDLGPLARQLNLVPRNPKTAEFKEVRALQKKVLNNLIDIEPTQKNLSEDMFLLAISGQVPIDKLLSRLQSTNNVIDVRQQIEAKVNRKISELKDPKQSSGQDADEQPSDLNGKKR